jgi:arginase family enzyme
MPEPMGPDMRFTKKFFDGLIGKGLKVIGFDINEVIPHYEPPAGLTTMNVCMVANWCLQLLFEGRRAVQSKA